ncbi:hypothetical protein [Leptothoe kymatousa]|uniref:DUF3040 domain-containing protein n=1 Tax=Leptothoe kymatousa TAU-MAC 1615 TaxID=2364775 RepID=A0ABS5Y6H8_9CYAN|nr:hypothetical protein [Leptothoe kymatousa]MBT9313464.1 hypothetical protein [Leptothoe kymatousa TAU-MAC 1615]
MNPDQSREEEFRQRETELRDREIKVRMQELESEIETTTTGKPVRQRRHAFSLLSHLPRWAQLILLFIGMILAIRIASALAGVFILFVIGWVGYKLFFERDAN